MGAKGTYKSTVIDNELLLAEWDRKKNTLAGFEPENTSLNSKQKVFWICSEGHEWSASVVSRYNKGSGCPECAIAARAKARRAATIKAKGSLRERYPEIAAEWHPTKNGALSPDHFSARSNDRVWWQCKKCGKEWQTSIGNRAKGTGCPVCAMQEGGKKHREYIVNKSGSLLDKFPEIAAEWHPTKNGQKLPEQYPPKSAVKIWWVCSECNTEWESAISNRTNGHGCPVCRNQKFAESYRKGRLKKVGSFADAYPHMAAEWHPTKNGSLKPEDFSFGSSKAIWWQCANGHEWQATISARTTFNTGCSICSGRTVDRGVNDIVTTHPEIAAEWHPTKNGDLKPSDFKIGSDKIVWWKCSRGHEWKTNIYHRQETGCPECIKEKFTSFPEQTIMYYVSQSFSDVRNRYILNNAVEIDIFIPEFSIAIEYDGSRFHNSKEALERERRKYKYLHGQGVFLIRVKEAKEDSYTEDTADVYLGYSDNKNNRYLERILEDLRRVLNQQCGTELSWNVDISRDRRAIYKQYVDLEKANSIAIQFPHLLDEWDYEKNEPVTPYMVTKGSEKVFWWRCSKGHEYESKVKDRVRNGCPYCSSNKVLTGFNDLGTTHPHLAREWIIERNNGIKPTEIIGGKQLVWWQCEKGHTWEASIDSRKRGNGCPVCAGKQVLAGYNDLATLNPDLADEWNYEKNNGLLLSEVVPGSNKKAWWKCRKYGHEWEAVIASRTRGNGCPYCGNQMVLEGFNDLRTNDPKLAAQWNYERNNDLLPTQVTTRSGKKVWWRCEFGHEWDAVISSRSSGRGCPYCNNRMVLAGLNDLQTKDPELARYWNYERNKGLLPTQISPRSHEKVWWKCELGHEWETSVHYLAQKRKCPICAKQR